jgi:hypothetical protein
VTDVGAGKRVAVLQSSYVPWKGYFDIIRDVDEFVFYDDVQFTKNDWRNRNLIKTAAGTRWLSIPVGSRIDRLVCEVELPRTDWAAAHWRQLTEAYRRAPFFAHYRPFFEDVYLGREWRMLSDLNQHLVRAIAHDLLGLHTTFTDSRVYGAEGVRQVRLLDLLGKVGAGTYVSGPSARSYIEPERFIEAGITLVWKDYAGYPEYPQLHPPFAHQVSVVDLLFNVGPEAPRYIWGWRAAEAARPA